LATADQMNGSENMNTLSFSKPVS